jgi:hypothetical protein
MRGAKTVRYPGHALAALHALILSNLMEHFANPMTDPSSCGRTLKPLDLSGMGLHPPISDQITSWISGLGCERLSNFNWMTVAWIVFASIMIPRARDSPDTSVTSLSISFKTCVSHDDALPDSHV